MTDNFCTKTAGMWQVAGYLLLMLKIVVPIIIIVLASIDLGKAVIASDDKGISKAATALMWRILLGIVIFFIPTVLDIIFNLLPNNESSIDVTTCSDCLLDPLNSSCE